VSKVYPLSGNEAVIGLNFFSEGAGNKEAMAARDSGNLVLGGPFNLIQGGSGLVGRKPVYIDTENEKHKFWGLVSITLKFPQALDGAELGLLELNGLAYELWRINPDTNERQVILDCYKHADPNARYIEKAVTILNANWHLRVAPVPMWYSYPESIILIVASLLVSLLVATVAQKNSQLRELAITDSLTGAYNRRYFMEAAPVSMERDRRLNVDAFIVILDVDKFKSINDTYGHTTGDKVLIETVSRIRAALRPYDLLARYGGEEFIIYVSNIKLDDVYGFAERLRLSICNQEFRHGDICFVVTVSLGAAKLDDNQDIDKAIKSADEAMYTAKKEGRNRVVIAPE
jgi:diguanylate cyclase (GGDEF)-like protein